MTVPSVSDLERIWSWREPIIDAIDRAPFMILATPARRQVADIRMAYDSPVLGPWLQNRYGCSLVSIAGRAYPATVVYESPEMKPDEVLAGSPRWRQPELQEYLRGPYWLIRSRVGRRRRHTFVLDSIKTPSERLTIECALTDSAFALKSSVSLEWELLAAVRRAERNATNLELAIPIRDAVHRSVTNPLLDGRARAAAVGITCVIAYSHNGRTEVRLHRRGRRSMVTRVGMFHAFPACIFQAPCQQVDIEYSIHHAFLWEYFEEFFNRPDKAHPRTSPKEFYNEPPIRELRSMFDSGTATHSLLGVAIDLMNLRPEVITLVEVRDPGWFEKTVPSYQLNPEFAGQSEAPTQSVSCTLDMHVALDGQFQANDLTPQTLVPCTAAALALTHKRLVARL